MKILPGLFRQTFSVDCRPNEKTSGTQGMKYVDQIPGIFHALIMTPGINPTIQRKLLDRKVTNQQGL